MNSLQKSVSSLWDRVAGWYWSARAIEVAFFRWNIDELLSHPSRSTEWNKEYVRMLTNFFSVSDLKSFCGDDLFASPGVLNESAKFSNSEINDTIARFSISVAGSYIRKYGRDTLKIVDMANVVDEISPNMTSLFSRYGIFQDHDQKDVVRFLDWHDSIAREEQERFWLWYLKEGFIYEILKVNPRFYGDLIQRQDDIPSNIVLYSHIAENSERPLSEILSLPQFDLEKIVEIEDKLDTPKQYEPFYTGVTGALEQGTLSPWLDHVLEQIAGDAIGGSNYRGAAA